MLCFIEENNICTTQSKGHACPWDSTKTKVFHNQLKRFDLAPSLAICNFTMSSTETNGHLSLRMPNIHGCRKKHYLAIRLSETTGKETTLPQA